MSSECSQRAPKLTQTRDEALLEKYGLKANDAILAEDKHQSIYDELINNRNAKFIAGGAAQNSARGAQVCVGIRSMIALTTV